MCPAGTVILSVPSYELVSFRVAVHRVNDAAFSRQPVLLILDEALKKGFYQIRISYKEDFYLFELGSAFADACRE